MSQELESDASKCKRKRLENDQQPTMSNEDVLELVKRSHEAKEFSYSPYSKFRVGAALMTTDGKMYTGCNIENASYSLTTCAERTAIFKAVSEGHRKFRAIAIASDLLPDGKPISPCGACRQVMVEFGHYDVYLSKSDKTYVKKHTSELLPMNFDRETLIKPQESDK